MPPMRFYVKYTLDTNQAKFIVDVSCHQGGILADFSSTTSVEPCIMRDLFGAYICVYNYTYRTLGHHLARPRATIKAERESIMDQLKCTSASRPSLSNTKHLFHFPFHHQF